jgi:uncharacterized protein
MLRVVHFEINADNPERAIEFYRHVFGWTRTKWSGSEEDYWLIMTGTDKESGINGGLMKRMNPILNTVNTVDVPSIDEYLEKIKASGGEIVMPKTTIPSIGYLAYCKDTEGNTFGIMQMDPNVK